MVELRKDPVIGRWVIVASERGNRPGAAFVHEASARKGGFCPFCEGNEHQTPPEVLSYRGPNTMRNERGWWVRVVPNKFPALRIEGQTRRMAEGMYDMMSGTGAHEVVIEHPDHNMDLADMPNKQIEEILWAYRERTIELHKDLRFRYILIFKNHGREAGASLEHAHSQIIALPIIPKKVQEELEGARKYYVYKERCVFCDIIRQELRDNSRVIAKNDTFVAFHPFASRFPYETWILPREHGSFYSEIQINEVSDLAAILKSILERFKTILCDPPFNFMIHTAPFSDEEMPHYHWHIELIPRLTRVAGFEWGTGFYINPISPEEAARQIIDANEIGEAGGENRTEPTTG